MATLREKCQLLEFLAREAFRACVQAERSGDWESVGTLADNAKQAAQSVKSAVMARTRPARVAAAAARAEQLRLENEAKKQADPEGYCVEPGCYHSIRPRRRGWRCYHHEKSGACSKCGRWSDSLQEPDGQPLCALCVDPGTREEYTDCAGGKVPDDAT